jgi:hypothetical protein
LKTDIRRTVERDPKLRQIGLGLVFLTAMNTGTRGVDASGQSKRKFPEQ